jgi:hypothetical protein
MKGLFLVESPFQLLSAFEATDFYNLSDLRIYIRLSGDINNDQELSSLSQVLFPKSSKIKQFRIENKSRSLNNIMSMAYYWVYFLIIQFKYDYIFLGNFDSRFLNFFSRIVKTSKIILLDDGIKNIIIQARFSDSFHFNLFTMLSELTPHDGQRIDYNTFEKAKKCFGSNQSKILLTNKVIFVGSKMSEIGVMSEDAYIDAIKQILSKYNHCEVIYIAHRGESTQKLAKLQYEIDFLNIQYLGYPLELYFLQETILPKTILSFYSAALIGLKHICSECQIESYLFNHLDSRYESVIQLCYAYFKKCLIPVHKIETRWG